MRGLLIGLAVVLLLLQWPLWLGEGSWRDVRDLREQVEEQRAANAELEQRNQALEAEGWTCVRVPMRWKNAHGATWA